MASLLFIGGSRLRSENRDLGMLDQTPEPRTKIGVYKDKKVNIHFKLVGVIRAAIGLSLVPSAARADFAVRFSTDGGTTWDTVHDGDARDLNPAAGQILVLFDGIKITANAAASTSPSAASLDLGISNNTQAAPLH